ncbi:YciI family protein [Leifsonia sp. fls2-241-R2A-40a]|uniref:YciI family protein n=1 Tax=Leifsonia sp. fls2-241-R2A-40a TaxID=3040290 RepID=UPI00254F9A94|nr:YciI family protein [Leifsonia sp. fls2-241-R2A-40a]
MSEFVILIYGDEQRWNSMSAAERAEIDAAHGEFRQKAGDAIRAAGELQGSATSTTVRRGDDGEPAAVDGPFTEAKEVVGGFYVIDVPDQATAVALASGLAEARHDHSGVQVQPLVDHSAG